MKILTAVNIDCGQYFRVATAAFSGRKSINTGRSSGFHGITGSGAAHKGRPWFVFTPKAPLELLTPRDFVTPSIRKTDGGLCRESRSRCVQFFDEMHDRDPDATVGRLMQANGEFLFVVISQDIGRLRVKAAERAPGIVVAAHGLPSIGRCLPAVCPWCPLPPCQQASRSWTCSVSEMATPGFDNSYIKEVQFITVIIQLNY